MKEYTRLTPIPERILSFAELGDGWAFGVRYEPRGSAFKLEELQRLISLLEKIKIPNKDLLSIMPGTSEPGEDSQINFDWEWSLKDENGKIPVDGMRYISLDINLNKLTIELNWSLGSTGGDRTKVFQPNEWQDVFDLVSLHVPRW